MYPRSGMPGLLVQRRPADYADQKGFSRCSQGSQQDVQTRDINEVCGKGSQLNGRDAVEPGEPSIINRTTHIMIKVFMEHMKAKLHKGTDGRIKKFSSDVRYCVTESVDIFMPEVLHVTDDEADICCFATRGTATRYVASEETASEEKLKQ